VLSVIAFLLPMAQALVTRLSHHRGTERSQSHRVVRAILCWWDGYEGIGRLFASSPSSSA